MDNITIYKHTSPSGKVYIGQTCRKPEYRWDNGRGYQSGYFHCAIKKYGWQNITHQILYTGLSQLDADLIEEDLIYYYQSIGKSYNLASGGHVNKGWKMSDLAKEKLRQAMLGRQYTPETIERIRASKMGDKNPNYGKSPSEETRFKISKALKGKNAKKVAQIDPFSGEIVYIWDSATEACKYFNGNPSLISDAIRRHSLTRGFYFKYL